MLTSIACGGPPCEEERTFIVRPPKGLRFFTWKIFSILCMLLVAAGIVTLSHNQTFASTAATTLATNSSSATANTDTSIFAVNPAFSNKVLHWTQTTFHYTSPSQDPTNGQSMTGDIWVSVGNDGIPNLIHVRYTSMTGVFLQESIQTRDMATIIFGSGYPNAGCQVVHQQFSQSQLLSALPSFVQGNALSSTSFLKGGGLTHALPITKPLVGITPVKSYAAGTNTLQRELHRAFTSGQTDIQSLTVNADDSRVLMQEVKLFDTTGKIVQDNWHAYGTLFVYNATTVPTTVYAQQVQEGCHA